MSRDNLRDHLPGAGKRRDDTAPSSHYRASCCEYRYGQCGGRGKPDIAIQDANKNVLGYVCIDDYMAHIQARGLDQFSQWKPTGTQLQTVQHTFDDDTKAKHFSAIVSELDALADRYVAAEQEDDGYVP